MEQQICAKMDGKAHLDANLLVDLTRKTDEQLNGRNLREIEASQKNRTITAPWPDLAQHTKNTFKAGLAGGIINLIYQPRFGTGLK